ncbi:MAG TPA: aspartate aminotransferase family protein [Balneola sp.]|nr:aspartate aminotransferase family protein [Balneola sp.]MAO76999.1 aspartate aminotransferase family protein [Balneola sp.]MBF64566.1 aspartate aminotransferase family protein [Balneola sp.]MBF65818.1 aspartate aminotransferase family protein [Balneola sp.]HBZ37045.1 aspartate aminotransferase family protein [Balneola sp.]
MALEISNAEGCYINTVSGESYLDFISGIAVSSLGHKHPKVISALHEQIDKHLHVMVYGEFVQKPQIEFAQLLLEQLPASMEQIYLVNSGTEATEGALKLAKKYTQRTKLVAFKNSYHGDTHGSLSVTGRDIYRDPYLPLLPDVHFSEFNSERVLDLIDIKTAAVILEPIQGEGGIIPAEKKWLRSIRKRCNECGVLLIFDEIQSGFGRTGKLFAFEQYEVIPDILCIAKAMGGGMPIGGFVSSTKIFQTFKFDPPLNHVTTFGGHPVSCAAAYANLKELLSGNYLQRASEIEQIVKSTLKSRGIVEVRGVGAMLGLEMENRDVTEYVVNYCFDKGILLGWTLHSNTLIRLAPPLIITTEQLKFVLETILESIESYY